MEQYICIHGHFYQPPRENPWLEVVELQDSAYPYHDWNERITAECYAPNAASRILDEKGFITQIVNNYAKISFNFGPTLLAWMENNAPEVYRTIIESDRESQLKFSGHGSALAQAYNHMILPLANRRDKYTQVLWGIRDFEHRFGRKPEGMWLPETAMNLETMEVLAELGISFTILTPRQSQRVRKIGSSQWEDAGEGKIDTTMAYRLNLPSGRDISIFFYDDSIARDVAFSGLLSNGEQFAKRLLDAFSKTRTWPQLVHIATDGETYGHHRRFADMALAYVLHYIESNNLAKITNYGEYLERYLPTHEVEIEENTSWSCAHGVGRWRSNCGCNSGAHPEWNQAWRAPLRKALDWLRDTLAPKYEEKAKALLKDPWDARDHYIEVVLDRSLPNIERFLDEHATRQLSETEKVTVLKLLELQRHAMLMYTSDGWFFDDISGIETIQNIQYAGRVIQLEEELSGEAIEPDFLKILEQAKSNIPEQGNGGSIYQKSVKPAMVDLSRVAANYAMTSLFEQYDKKARVYSYITDCDDYQSYSTSGARLALGRVKVTSEITLESAVMNFGAILFGEYSLNASVQGYGGKAAYQAMVQEVTQALFAPDFREVVRRLDKHFGISTYSLRSVFQDEQHKVLDRILKSTLADVEATYRRLYERHYPPIRFFTRLGSPLPKAFQQAAELILSIDLRRALSSDTLDEERIRSLLDEAKSWKVELDTEGLSHVFAETLEQMMARFASTPQHLSLLKNLMAGVALARSMTFDVNLWKVQNLYYEMSHTIYPEFQKKVKQRDKAAAEWTKQFLILGEHLSIRVKSSELTA